MKIAEKALLLTDFQDFFQDFQKSKQKIERVISGGYIALCNNIYTKNGIKIAFAFNFEDRKPEYDNKIVSQYPDYFYLEDNEVLAVKNSAQYQLNLEEYIQKAKNHPTDAIDIIVVDTQKSCLTNKQATAFEQDFEDWYW